MPRIPAVVFLGLALFASPALGEEKVPKLEFNEVKEIAKGVYFRYSSISATDKNVPFGGSNHAWVVFEDYVVVIDANFPKEARDVIAAVKKTTDKPIRYVFDTHHHGDHAYGNAVFAEAGASIIAQTHCARLLRVNGPKEFADAGKGPGGREDIAKSKLKVPNVVFDDKLVLDDGKQRVEFHYLGHAHTVGDAVAYLPKQKILCTGDACLNGAFNYMGHGDSASWIQVLEKMQQFDVQLVCPGHGPLADKSLIERQKRYFVDLREQVGKAVAAGKNEKEVIASIDMPWYKEWTGVTPPVDNIKHVYGELTGLVGPTDLVDDFSIYEGPSPTKETPGWKKPRRIIVPNLMPARLNELKRVAPDVLFVPVRSAEDAAKEAGDADAVLGFCTADIVKAGKNLRWIQVGHAGVEKDLNAELAGSSVALTNTQRLYGPNVADQAMALLLCLTRGLREAVPGHGSGVWKAPEAPPRELHGKTMLVIGLGGIGTQISRRAHAFGMRVMAIDPKDMERPAFVFSLDKPERLTSLIGKADVVVVACPLTKETRGMIGKEQLAGMKKGAYLINIARGGVVDTATLVDALEKKHLGGAGLDVADPEPLPDGHALWKMKNVVISPHIGGQSDEARDRQWRLWRENVRRFAAGEPLLCVVDKGKGY